MTSPEARAREACGIPDSRAIAPRRTVPDDKFAVVVRECLACGCSTARPCGTKQWSCDYCGADMTMPGVWTSDWRHHDNYGTRA